MAKNRSPVATGALLAAILVGAGGPAFADDVPSLAQSLVTCHHLAKVKARVACYDALAERAEKVASAPGALAALAPQAMTAASGPPIGSAAAIQQHTAAATPIAQPPTSAAASAPPATSPAPADSHTFLNGDLGKVTLTIASVGTTEDGLLRITTSDGFTWDQSEQQQIRAWPKTGDTLTIRKNFLGGQWCSLNTRDVYHCKPLRK